MAGELPPKKVAWLAPWQLVKTGFHVWLETIGSGLVDRREVMAALDRRSNAVADFKDGFLKTGHCIDGYVERSGDTPLTVDFVADVGDSWEATYSVATLLADPKLRQRFPQSAAASLPKEFCRGDLLVLGGDLVYPWPARDTYRRRLVAPFSAALPLETPSQPARPSLVAIPGNHDWYDGLNGFTRALCQGDSLGGWKLGQTRSYFAIKLINGWWIWGIDIALDTRIDAPQLAYFKAILDSDGKDETIWPKVEQFGPDDRIILCTAKPAWLDMSRYSDEAYRNLMTFVDDVIHGANEKLDDRKKHKDVPVILTGDLHHYCHYKCAPSAQASDARPKSPSHMIVAGGGGAYLMGTHFLPQNIPALSKPPSLPELSAATTNREETSGFWTDPFTLTAAQYPNMAESRRLALGSIFLALRPQNWQFCLVLGLMYLLLTPGTRRAAKIAWTFSPLPLLRLLWHHLPDVSWVWAVAVLVLCVAFAVGANGRASRVLTVVWGAMHAFGHALLALSLSIAMTSISRLLIRWPVFVVAGGLIAGTVVGIYLAVSDRYFDLHHNDAFAVQSIIDYRNFLRMIIEPSGALVIYPIGLRRVPRRWRTRIDREPTDPLYEPADATLSPHLIEGPIRIPAKS